MRAVFHDGSAPNVMGQGASFDYTVELGWYERVYSTCYNGPFPYPCYTDTWKTSSTLVSPSPLHASLNLGQIPDSADKTALIRVLCQNGYPATDMDFCEAVLHPNLAPGFVLLELPYQVATVTIPTVTVPGTNTPRFYWRFSTENGTHRSGATAWATFTSSL